MIKNNKKELSPFAGLKLENLVAGVSGGVTSTFLLHPLDLMKIRFAVKDVGCTPSATAAASARPHYNGLYQAMFSVFQTEGIKGLYKGVTPNICGSGSAWGFYFLFYNTIKSWLQGGNEKIHLGPALHMLAAAEAGILTLVMTNPIWVIKTRMCLQFESKNAALSRHNYSGMMDAFFKTYKYEGVRGFYKGFIPGVIGVSHGALQFMVYEELKARYNTYRKLSIETRLNTMEYLTFAAISKLFAAVTTYPYQVIRARLQDQHSHYISFRHCIKETWRYEGIFGFYKGLWPYLLHATPNVCLVFVIYETIAGDRM